MALHHEELARARWHDAQRQQLLRSRTATVVAARKGAASAQNGARRTQPS